MDTNCGYSRVAQRKLSVLFVVSAWRRAHGGNRHADGKCPPDRWLRRPFARGNARSVYRNNSDLKTSQRAATAGNALARAVEEA